MFLFTIFLHIMKYIFSWTQQHPLNVKKILCIHSLSSDGTTASWLFSRYVNLVYPNADVKFNIDVNSFFDCIFILDVFPLENHKISHLLDNCNKLYIIHHKEKLLDVLHHYIWQHLFKLRSYQNIEEIINPNFCTCQLTYYFLRKHSISKTKTVKFPWFLPHIADEALNLWVFSESKRVLSYINHIFTNTNIIEQWKELDKLLLREA
jgi:hypothetical protein